MVNQEITAGMQAGFQICWRFGIVGVQVLDYKMAKSGRPRFLVDQDPRALLRLKFDTQPDIQEPEKEIIGMSECLGCEIVWRKS